MMGPSRRLGLLLARIGEARHFTARRTVCLLGDSCSLGPAISILVLAMLHGSRQHCRDIQACSHALGSAMQEHSTWVEEAPDASAQAPTACSDQRCTMRNH